MLSSDPSATDFRNQPHVLLDTRFVAVAFVVIATVIPSDLRLATDPYVLLDVWTHDIPINLALYVPLGLTLARWGGLRVVSAAVALSMFAEGIQLLLPNRLSQPTDVLFNALGALIGFAIAKLLPFDTKYVRLNRAVGLIAASLALIWLASCPAICSNVAGFNAPFDTFLHKPAYGRGLLNATVQLTFGLCHRQPPPNAALIGMLMAIALLGFVQPAVARGRWLTGAIGGAAGGAVVWFEWSDPGHGFWPVVIGLLAGVGSAAAVKSSRSATPEGRSHR
jgi:hypothetical protein